MGLDPRWFCLDPPPPAAGKAGVTSVPGTEGRRAQPRVLPAGSVGPYMNQPSRPRARTLKPRSPLAV